jgi:hypothetical protein
VGGKAVTLKLDALPGGGLNDDTAEALLKELWQELDDSIRGNVRGAARTEVLTEYFPAEVHDGLNGRWSATPSAMQFVFMDAAGCCSVAMGASIHWVELTVAHKLDHLDAIARNYGVRIVTPRLRVSEIVNRAADRVFVDVASRLCQVSPPSSGYSEDTPDAGIELSIDLTEMTMARLSPAERERVREACRSGLCPCSLCSSLRKEVTRWELARARW